MLLSTPSNVFSRLLQSLMLECLHFLSLLDSCLMMDECSYSWCAVSMLCSFCVDCVYQLYTKPKILGEISTK